MSKQRRRSKFTDPEILAAVERVRDRNGKCSYDDLVAELGMSKTGVAYRVRVLSDAQMLRRTPGQEGSIRLGPAARRPSLLLNLRVTIDGTGRATAVELIR